MSKKRGIFFILGTILGFVGGLLLAPKKGSEFREDAKEKIDKVKENPKEVLHETLEEVKEKITSLKEDLSEDNNIKISEEDIVISKSFNDRGEN